MGRKTYSESFTVNVPIERAWDVMADTQHLNQLFFGLSAATVESRDVDKARIRGSFGPLAPVYDEYPWVFEVPRRYKSLRVFDGGLLKRLESECVLKETGGGTVVDYAVRVDAVGGPLGAVAGAVTVRRTRAGLAKIRAMLAKMAAEPGAVAPAWPPANPQAEAVAQRAAAVVAGMRVDDDAERQALERIVRHVAEAPEADVARMRPYELADAWGLSRKKALAACLRATQAGLLRLSWDLLCPSCEAPSSVKSLKDLPEGGHCPACDIDFTTSFEQNVEATFSPEPAIRQAERLLFCHGSPSSTKSWLAQFVVEPREKQEITLRLGAGRYRLQAQGIARGTLIDVDEDGAADVRVAIETLEGQPRLPAQVPAAKAGSFKLFVENTRDDARRVQIAHRAFASKAATAADVTAVGLFRELFGGEALAPDQHLDVGRGTIVFTDLCGSTAMYERVGDASAYGLVREHFRLLFAAVDKHGGRVVKTVGDCVMASFDSPVDAVRAGRACVVALRSLRDKDGGAPGLALKVGVHTGPCLAVEANGQVDYFGRTVNIAARVESLAGPDEVVLSWSTAGDRDVRAWLDDVERGGDAVHADKRAVKGIAGDVDVVRVGVNSAAVGDAAGAPAGPRADANADAAATPAPVDAARPAS